MTVTVYVPSSAYVCEPAIVPLDGVPGPPLISAIEAPVIASRPSPQLMSYVNDSCSGSVIFGGTAAFGLSGLSKPGSVNVARFANETVLAFEDRLIAIRRDNGRSHVVDRDGKLWPKFDAAIVIVHRDRDRVRAVIGIRMRAADRAAGRRAGPPFTSAIEAPVIASRPSPQLMSYVNDSCSGSVIFGGTAAFGLSGLSNPGSVNVARFANETVAAFEDRLIAVRRRQRSERTLLTVTVNVAKFDAAIVVVNGDRDGVRAVIGIGVRAADRAAGWRAGPTVDIGDRSARDRIASITPIDVVRKRLVQRIGNIRRNGRVRIERIVEPGIGERGQIRER